MGLAHPRMVEVPLLSPRLSSLWVRFVTRAQWSVAREVVVGLTEDLLARDDRFWRLIGHPNRLGVRRGGPARPRRRAPPAPVPGAWGVIERVRGLAVSPRRERRGAVSAPRPRVRRAESSAALGIASTGNRSRRSTWPITDGLAVGGGALGTSRITRERRCQVK